MMFERVLKKTSLTLDEQDFKLFKQICRVNNSDASKEIRKFIKEYIGKNKKQKKKGFKMEKVNIYQAAGLAINKGGFIVRLFAYFVIAVPMSLLYVFGILLPSKFFGGLLDFSKTIPDNDVTITLLVIFYLLPIILFFVFWESRVRKFRRENGLSIYGNIEKELEQMEFNELYAKEMRAKEACGVASVGDKRDLNYWFDLLQKGAISKEEYEAKKAELI